MTLQKQSVKKSRVVGSFCPAVLIRSILVFAPVYFTDGNLLRFSKIALINSTAQWSKFLKRGYKNSVD